jgi:hypothetical protein
MFETVLTYVWQALSVTLIQILILMGPGLLLTIVLNYETRFVQKLALNTIGLRWYLALFGWLGTIVHELGHAIFCIIFGHKITDMNLFQPDSDTGTLGYVRHSYVRTNVYQLTGNFFIGIGPILLGTGIIFLLSFWLLHLNISDLGGFSSYSSSQINSWDTLKNISQSVWNSSGQLFAGIFSWQHLSSWQLYVFIYLVFAIGSSITLSPPDIKAALGGFIVIIILLFILNLATLWAGNFISGIVIGMTSYYVLFYAIIFLILIINLVVTLLGFLPLSLLRPNHSKNN